MLLKTFLKHFLICILLLGIPVLSAETIVNELVNKNVDTTVDIASQLVKISSKITLENTGKTSIKSFLLSSCASLKDNIAYIGAQIGSTKLRISEVKVTGQTDKLFWRVDLKEELQAGKSVVVEADSSLTRYLKPHPTQITQREKQLILFESNVFFHSPYKTLKQKKSITLTTHSVDSYTQFQPVALADNVLTYGPYENKEPFSYEKLIIHYENNSPFLTITRLQRVIEVSHWGNIAVEETIDIEHQGAKLKGSFSRYEYQREAQSGVASVKSFKTALPASAQDVYYRDEIGNISTSHMRVLSDSVELDLRPRFPLFGGWKTHYVLGYNVPSYEYLYNNGEQFLLKMRVLDHVFDDMVVDEVITKVILPEGSRDIELSTPYPVRRLPDTFHYTYLDSSGRPVISITKKNLVEAHIDDFELKYSYPQILLFQEPVLIIVALFALFFCVICYVRTDFSITKDEAEENRLRTAGYAEKVLSYQDKRASFYQDVDDLFTKLKGNKDANSFQSSIKILNQEYKSITAKLNELLAVLKTEAADIAEKLNEIQKMDRNLREIYLNQQNFYLDKFITGKLHRNTFMEQENEFQKKKEDFNDKINAIIKSM